MCGRNVYVGRHAFGAHTTRGQLTCLSCIYPQVVQPTIDLRAPSVLCEAKQAQDTRLWQRNNPCSKSAAGIRMNDIYTSRVRHVHTAILSNSSSIYLVVRLSKSSRKLSSIGYGHPGLQGIEALPILSLI